VVDPLELGSKTVGRHRIWGWPSGSQTGDEVESMSDLMAWGRRPDLGDLGSNRVKVTPPEAVAARPREEQLDAWRHIW
jgi:hypothetical protein